MNIDPAEAIHKARLQELLGLRYDEFLSLTASQTEVVLVRLLRHLEAEAAVGGTRLSLNQFQQAAAALDTVFRLNVEIARCDLQRSANSDLLHLRRRWTA
jgi:hypothetical protein